MRQPWMEATEALNLSQAATIANERYNFSCMLEPGTSVKFVKGIGPRFAEMLATKSIHTVDDLLYYLPFRYEDRVNPRRISELQPGETASVIGEVRNSGLFTTRKMPIFQLVVGDPVSFGSTAAAGSTGLPYTPDAPLFGHSNPAGFDRSRTLKCLWFHGAYLKDKFKPGQLLALYGKVEASHSGGLEVIQPQIEVLNDPSDALLADGILDCDKAEAEAARKLAQSLEIGRIVPIYEAAGKGKLTSRWFRRIIRSILEQTPRDAQDYIPAAVRGHLQLVAPREALWQVHWPEAGESIGSLQAWRTPAQRRLIFEELFFLELGVELKRRQQRAQTGIAFALDAREREAVKRILPFKPTKAQYKVLGEIAKDMAQPTPMRRLLQGDVGSGKTIIALQAAVIAMENGYQVALMAPTEILATQHYLSARRILEPAGYRCVLLTGSQEADRKRSTRRHLARGDAQLAIGTHALIEQKVEFQRLGLVIVDEQHRFGVMQRMKLMKKPGQLSEAPAEPDVLVMTATPIPRTLALTLYGDLDVSILDELPPGRTPITTHRYLESEADTVWEMVRSEVAHGHQAYVVYPVIEENEEREVKAATQMYEALRLKIMPQLRVGLLHGRLDADVKDAVMQRFQRHELDVLVATTVIEVGVDVPNASIMVVEHADKFGLAQLHQLRGRIGRGTARSHCVLMTSAKMTEDGEKRLDAMLRTSDGFQIAEMDLQLRGPGEFFGTKQAGMPNFRVANLLRDVELLQVARREAAWMLDQQKLGSTTAAEPAQVSAEEILAAINHMRTHWNRRFGLVEVG